MSSKFSLVLVALAGFLVLASAINLNHPGQVGPTPVEPALLKFLLDQQRNKPDPIPVEPTKTDVSLWERAVLSPFSRMALYLRTFGCSSVAPPSVTCSCGIQGAANRIIGGQESALHKWPWMAYLLKKNDVGQYEGIGGTLINKNWVITIASEVRFSDKVVVYLGINDITVAALHVTNASVVTHEQFDLNTKDNNIALLKLEKSAPLSAAIQPICLPYNFSMRDFSGQNATVTGWGYTSKKPTTTTNKLMEVTMSILNKTQCTTSPYKYYSATVTDNMFCMYGQDSVGACTGDSGGPVIWQNGTSFYLLGMFTINSCGEASYPGIYTKVSNYLNWITNTTGQTFCNV